MNIIVDFKNIILALRNERGFSQEQLAKVLHVSKSTVAMWETGQRLPSVELLIISMWIWIVFMVEPL